jgi:tetratricopeptide (TPR) repeat protein
MKKIVVRLFAITVSGMIARSVCAAAEPPMDAEKVFEAANAYYASGDYGKAIEKNEYILDSGYRSGNLYYNLGNCYLKKGGIGKAVLNYERAKRFIPQDSALLSNLRYAKSLMKQADANKTGAFILKKLGSIFDYATLKGAAAVFNMFYLLSCAAIVASFFVRTRKFFIRASALLMLCVAFMLIVPLRDKIDRLDKEGIVTASIADAKFEPSKDAVTNFPLYEGMKVYILKTREAYCKIKRLDGKIGWVEKGAVERVNI